MALRRPDRIFLGNDYERPYHIKTAGADDETEGTTSIDISGWALSWMVKRHHDQADNLALLTKTTAGGAIVIAGTFSATPAANAQRATLTLEDTDTDTAINPGMYHWELKRTDAGFETVLAYGTFECVQGVHR